MIKKIILIFIIVNTNKNIQAQLKIEGEYYLTGVREIASGFLLKPDSTFQFFFSYGALDREGTGRWTVRDNQVIFDSRPKPLLDFALIESKKVSNESTIIKIIDSSSVLNRYVRAFLKFADTTIEEETNSKGEISVPEKGIKSISLMLEFCPEKTSVFNIDKAENYFEFRFEPYITEFFFEHFHLKIGANELKGGHPLLKEDEYTYEKQVK